ncbi:sialic acid synthase isoform X1 [Schistocerca gregaria]|uniref:sialic acid synthase isoform X1 n=2 Tax=Schistocerca gregaria TaxID=7010 RepID=UPI00211E5935|nr:sialic acid synthase isoform X1 [Schistocerca gregaria]
MTLSEQLVTSAMAADIDIAYGKIVGTNEPCFIIAEIGQNHQGDIGIAKKLISYAKKSGADCVKFQKSCLSEKFNAEALNRPYENENSWGKTYGEHKRFLEFDQEQFRELQRYAEEEVGIMFSASAMDMVSVDMLDSLNVPFIKIGSGDANNFPLLRYAAFKKRPMFISTGMTNMEIVKKIYHCVRPIFSKFCLLHCVSSYPTKPEEVNLRVITTFKQEFPDIHIGYSGHEVGIAISIAAIAMGSKVLERHITLNKSWKGSDHKCSLTPEEFTEMVTNIRIVEQALGNPQKKIQPSELLCYKKLGKTLVAGRDLKLGSLLTQHDIKIKVAEPKGIKAEDMEHVLGKKIIRDIKRDESICLTDLTEIQSLSNLTVTQPES